MTSKDTIYSLILLLSSLTSQKIKILVLLSHIHPTRVSIKQLNQLMGYHKNSRKLNRGVIQELEDENLIIVERTNPKHLSIQLASYNPIMQSLVELVIEEGEKYAIQLHQLLEQYGSDI